MKNWAFSLKLSNSTENLSRNSMPGMWGSMVEYITVDKDKNMTVTFKDGSEIQA